MQSALRASRGNAPEFLLPLSYTWGDSHVILSTCTTVNAVL